MTNSDERIRILTMLAEGRLTTAESLALLDALGNPAELKKEQDKNLTHKNLSEPNWLKQARNFWALPLILGAGLTLTMLVNAGASFWAIFCFRIPLFFLGAFLMLVAWSLRDGTWLTVYVNLGQDEWPHRVIIGLPLPLRPLAWLVRMFGGWVPGIDLSGLDEVFLALSELKEQGTPLHVEVQQDGGETVQVFIG